MFDEIIFVFEKCKLRILPICDTDEIGVECLEEINTEAPELAENTTILNAHVGKTLSMTWNCVNANGYFDLYALGFDELHPSVMILSEGSALKLFGITKINNNGMNDTGIIQ